MRKSYILLLFGLFSPCAAAFAQDANNPLLTSWGVTFSENTAPNCAVTTSIDQPTFAAHVQDMVDADIFSKKVSPTLGNVAPHYLMNIFEAETAPYIVKGFFDRNPTIDQCTFVFQYVNPDDYGNNATYPMVSFDFTRALYQKVNWPRFNEDNLRKIAPNFKGDAHFGALLNDETFPALMMLKSNE